MLVGCDKHNYTRASCNDVSNIGTIEVDSHSNTSAKLFSEMVHNSYSFSHSQSTVHGAYHSSIGCQFVTLSTCAYENRNVGSI